MKLARLLVLLLTLPFFSQAQVPPTEREVLTLLTKKWTPIQIGKGEDKVNVPIIRDYIHFKADSTTEHKQRRKITRSTWTYDHERKRIHVGGQYEGTIKKLTATSLIVTFLEDGLDAYILYKPLLQ